MAAKKTAWSSAELKEAYKATRATAKAAAIAESAAVGIETSAEMAVENEVGDLNEYASWCLEIEVECPICHGPCAM